MDHLHLNATLVRVALPLLLLIVIALICASTFRVLAGERVSWRAALAGGGVSGVILLITPTLAGYYTRWAASNTPVKAFLVLAGVLITCYIVAIGLLLGAAVVARLQLGHTPNARIAAGFSCSRSSDRDPQTAPRRRGTGTSRAS